MGRDENRKAGQASGLVRELFAAQIIDGDKDLIRSRVLALATAVENDRELLEAVMFAAADVSQKLAYTVSMAVARLERPGDARVVETFHGAVRKAFLQIERNDNED